MSRPYDPYEVLGVPRDADQDAIKCAYARQAARHHPDRKQGDHDKMTAVNQAYETLSNPELRRQYDEFGVCGRQISVEQEARRLVLSAFVQLAKQRQWAPYRYVFQISQQIKQEMSQAEKTLTRCETRLNQLETLLPEGPAGLFDDALMEGRRQLGQEMAELTMRLKVFKAALELLKDYHDKASSPAEAQRYQYTTTTTGVF